ncbi:predicted protein [Thalassiosira pseudonana CCMP1335]|uniref:ATP-grasp domain-containing protein n=1 Tax=Thalassiosira pseudonana TaxID=35128 RepID=B5YMI9_THAPS|nr:predicted protein [Thalassiosira pseudonana CCMP1335]ACI64816.1 predicted protein [Thalassiosira pseudonana CCMP1335]
MKLWLVVVTFSLASAALGSRTRDCAASVSIDTDTHVRRSPASLWSSGRSSSCHERPPYFLSSQSSQVGDLAPEIHRHHWDDTAPSPQLDTLPQRARRRTSVSVAAAFTSPAILNARGYLPNQVQGYAPFQSAASTSKWGMRRKGGRRLQFDLLSQSINVRGGSQGETDDDVVDGNEYDEETDITSTKDDDNEMQQLRKQWSESVPSVPTIEWPITNTMLDDHGMEEGSFNTLADFDTTPHEAKDEKKTQQPTKALLIMDGFSPYHAQYLSGAAQHIYGAAVIHVLSDFMARYLYQVEEQTDHLSSRMPDLDKGDEVEAWKSLIPSEMEICGLYCESDSGLEDAERMGVALGLYPRCHDGINQARRDKFLMNQVVSEAGLDTVKQKLCQTLEEAEEFARELGLQEEDVSSSTLVVAKPLRGVASDDVHLCSNLPSIRAAFNKIYRSPVFGASVASKHDNVLFQEFAKGTEYAIDVVCRDGDRKVAALWKYDKRAVNGAPFVYFSTQLVSAEDEDGNVNKKVEQAVCDYVFSALEALDIRWGLSHVECIVEEIPDDADETKRIRVRLVEVNCRQHNTDFCPLASGTIGYNALDMVLAAYLGSDPKQQHKSEHGYPPETKHLRLEWDSFPTLPSTRARGAVVHFVSFVEGRISRIRYDVLEEVQELDSVMDMHVYPQFLEVGNEIGKTVDIRTDTGWAHIMNSDKDKFVSDYQRLVELMKDMFEVE